MKPAGIASTIVLASVVALHVHAQSTQSDLFSSLSLTCTNTEPPGGVDSGCESTLNACTDAGTCVDCQNDTDCSLAGDVCNVETSSCVQCLDSGPGAQDDGCEDASLNACLNGGSASAMCVDCAVDADCADGFVCDTGANACVECTLNSDCAEGLVCHTETKACVECAVDADCAEGFQCDTQTNVCVFIENLIFWDSFETLEPSKFIQNLLGQE